MAESVQLIAQHIKALDQARCDAEKVRVAAELDAANTTTNPISMSARAVVDAFISYAATHLKEWRYRSGPLLWALPNYECVVPLDQTTRCVLQARIREMVRGMLSDQGFGFHCGLDAVVLVRFVHVE